MNVSFKSFITLLNSEYRQYTYQQLADVTSQLAEMLEAGVDIQLSFYTLSKYASGKKIFRDNKWRQLLEDGKELSTVFKEYRFPKLFINTVMSGEQSGSLYQSLFLLADYYNKLAELKNKLIQALIYPCMVMLTVLFSLYFMLQYVLPNFRNLYRGLGLTIPESTKMLFEMQAWLMMYQHQLLLIVVIISLFIYLSIRITSIRQYLLWIGLYIPGIKFLVRYVNTHMLVMQLSMLIKGGVSVQEAFQDIDKLFSGPIVRQVKQMKHMVLSGIPLSQAINSINCFDININNFIEMGESTGRLDAAFTSAEVYYNQTMKNIIQYLMKGIEPILLLIMGVTVLFVIISMLLPVFDLLETL